MSGLPRSGSTLLSSILNQNTNIYCSTNSPLLHLNLSVRREMLSCEQYRAFPRPECLDNVFSSLAHNFYQHYPQSIIVDKSRSWPLYVDDIIKKYITEDVRIICPVRNILSILSSFINLIENSDGVSYVDQNLNDLGLEINNTNRCDYLMSYHGTVGEPYNIIRRCIAFGHRELLLFVDYDDLLKSPQNTMSKIYQFLDLPEFRHNFDNICQDEVEDDSVYGMKNMHTVKPRLTTNNRNYFDYLDKNTIEKYKNMEFWKEKTPLKIFGLHT